MSREMSAFFLFTIIDCELLMNGQFTVRFDRFNFSPRSAVRLVGGESQLQVQGEVNLSCLVMIKGIWDSIILFGCS